MVDRMDNDDNRYYKLNQRPKKNRTTYLKRSKKLHDSFWVLILFLKRLLNLEFINMGISFAWDFTSLGFRELIFSKNAPY